jgi:hypothetical protein
MPHSAIHCLPGKDRRACLLLLFCMPGIAHCRCAGWLGAGESRTPGQLDSTHSGNSQKLNWLQPSAVPQVVCTGVPGRADWAKATYILFYYCSHALPILLTILHQYRLCIIHGHQARTQPWTEGVLFNKGRFLLSLNGCGLHKYHVYKEGFYVNPTNPPSCIYTDLDMHFHRLHTFSAGIPSEVSIWSSKLSQVHLVPCAVPLAASSPI